MTSKRPVGDTTNEGPNPKRNRTRSTSDDLTTHYSNENIYASNPVQNYSSAASVYDFDDFDEVKDEPPEVKDEPFDEMGCDPPGWEAGEKPLVCEVPVELDDSDPLRPLNTESEVKDEQLEEKVKTEDADGFEEHFASAEPLRSAEDEDFELKNPKTREDAGFSIVGLQDGSVTPELKNNASKLRADFFQPSTSRAQIFSTRPQKRNSMIAVGLKTQGKSCVDVGTSTQELGIEAHTESHRDHAGTNLRAETPKSSTNPSALADKPDKITPDDPGTSFVVQLLVETHFLMKNRTKEQENNIIRAGRPTPLMGNMQKCLDPKEFLGRFWATTREYQLIPWLTGLKMHFKYFCWPCLLFTKERWSLQGGESRQKFWEAINKHNVNPLHRVAYENLKIRQSELKDSKIIGPDPKDTVRKNRAFLALLLQILCSKKTKLFNTDSNFDGYEELMKLAISYEPELHQSVGKSLSEDGLVDFVSRHAQKLLRSIQTKIAVRIYEDISSTPFVSIIYEDTENVVDRSTQVAVILRFVTENGDFCERFVKFVKIGQSRNAYDILEVHLALVEEFGLREKLIGYTFSGTVVAPASIEEFIKIVSKECPKAKFFHHPDHNLKELLLQSLSHLEECQRFLEVIADLVKFLTTNSGAIPTLVTFIKHNQPNCQQFDDASFTIDIISTIRHYYPLVIQFFLKVSQKFWNDEVAKHAPIFMKFLQEPFNRFLIAVIARILDAADNLCKVMEKDYDRAEWKFQSATVLDTLNQLQENGVKHFLYLASNGKMQQSSDRFIDVAIPHYCPETFRKIIETAMNCILHRAWNADAFYLNSTYSKVSDILRAPAIWGRYGWRFHSLKEFHKHMNLIKIFSSTFTKKSIPEIIKAVANVPIGPKFLKLRDFLRFCALAISPTKSAPSAPSALLRLKSYLKDKQKFNPTEVLMFLEKGLLRSQLKKSEFIEDVITHYAKKNNEYNFLYDFSETCKSEIDKFE